MNKTTKKVEVIEISPSPSSESSKSSFDGTPLRPIFCLKKNKDMDAFDQSEDCYMLGFDPDSEQLSKLSLPIDSDDIAVLAEKGKVACRDYPHPRHLCLKFPWKDTPFESHCELCYCYVCDLAAPCKQWNGIGVYSHCGASEHEGVWKMMRLHKKAPAAACKN